MGLRYTKTHQCEQAEHLAGKAGNEQASGRSERMHSNANKRTNNEATILSYHLIHCKSTDSKREAGTGTIDCTIKSDSSSSTVVLVAKPHIHLLHNKRPPINPIQIVVPKLELVRFVPNTWTY
jgi:hypothetical protein